MLPQPLRQALRPITLVVGHYGVGKTNLSCNLALEAASSGGFDSVTVVDLDIVNPYFRASEQRALLEGAGVRLVAPYFAEAGSSLDVPSLRGAISTALGEAGERDLVILDVGGDDAGTTALGRFAPLIARGDYAMLGVANRFRNLVSTPQAGMENLREIEAASGLSLTGLVDNAHLKGDTDAAVVQEGYDYARQLAELMGLPLLAVSIPRGRDAPGIPTELAWPLDTHVRNPWE